MKRGNDIGSLLPGIAPGLVVAALAVAVAWHTLVPNPTTPAGVTPTPVREGTAGGKPPAPEKARLENMVGPPNWTSLSAKNDLDGKGFKNVTWKKRVEDDDGNITYRAFPGPGESFDSSHLVEWHNPPGPVELDLGEHVEVHVYRPPHPPAIV